MSRLPNLRVSWWDRFLIGIAPGWGVRRIHARAAAMSAARYYDAAGGGRRTSSWRRGSGDANQANQTALVTLREISRDLRRNNGWARRGIQAIANNTVGWGILAKPTGLPPAETKRALEIWNAWADTAACDFDGRVSFYGLQRLVMEAVVESGEALVIRQPADVDEGIPLRIQVLEADYLDTGKSQPASEGKNKIIQGIEVDARGKRVAYWMHESHPGSSTGILASRRVAADDVLHIYRIERPGQRRGVAWLAAAVARLKDFTDYADAVLEQQKVAACFAAFVQDVDGGGGAPLGMLASSNEAGRPTNDLEIIEPGTVQHLPVGKSVTFPSPPASTNHATFSETNLREIAATLGVTYEDLTGDYSKVNFSSARVARLAHWQNVNDWRWNMLIPQLCDGVFGWAMELAAGLEGWSVVPRAWWSPQPMPMLEPDKEGLAYQRLVRNGVMTLEEMIRERGSDPRSHLEEYARGNALLDELGIILDSDPRRTSAAGGLIPGQAAGGGAPGTTPGDDDEAEQ